MKANMKTEKRISLSTMPGVYHAFLLYLPLAVLCGVSAQPLTPGQEADLEEFISATISCRSNAALSVALVRGGQAVYTRGFGLRDVDRALPMTSSTRINIGSLTKAFTTALCADSVSRGLVTWDGPLRDVLGPEFTMEGPYRTAQISLRDALAHRVGFPTYWGVSTAALNVSRQVLCMERLEHFTAMYDFRAEPLYSNYNFVLGGYVHEVVSGLPWHDSLHATLLEPLGMNDTRAATRMAGEDWADTAFSYILQDDVYVVNPEQDQLPFLMEIDPAGGIFSTAEDIAKWMQFQLDKGQLPSGEVLIPEEDLEETHTAASYNSRESPKKQKPGFPVDDTTHTRALGWNNGMYRGYEQLEHTGSYSSYNCRLSLLPEKDMGAWACVSSPGDYRGSRAVTTVIKYGLDLLLDVEPWLNTTTTCTYPDPWRENLPDEVHPGYSISESPSVTEVSLRTQDLKVANEDYVGEYFHPGFDTFTIYQNTSDLSLSYEFGLLLSGEISPSGTPEMFHMTLNYPISYRMAFFPEYPDGFPIYFTRDNATGAVSTVQVDYLEFDLPPVFNKV